MKSTPESPAASLSPPTKFRVFVDFWNLQLTLNERIAEHGEETDGSGFKIDWRVLPRVLVEEAARILQVKELSYEGALVFTSHDANTAEGKKYHKWATSWLDAQAGVQVTCFERRPKHPPRCPACHTAIKKCPFPHCGADMAGTIEKGVDTAIATDMIRLAWEKAYDVAVLASSDADLVPAVKFLDLKGFRVLQAGFPPLGSHLARACWGTIDMFALRERFRRT